MEKHEFDFTCPECGTQFRKEAEINDLDAVYSEERSMGPETQYDFMVTTSCPNCKREFEVQGEVWEYPVGDFTEPELRK